MPLGLDPSNIRNPEFRDLLTRAREEMVAGNNRECVQLCGEAYLLALQRYPAVRAGLDETLADEGYQRGIAEGITRVAPYLWPRFVSKLDMSGPEPAIGFDRKNVSYAEAIEYFEFTMDLLVAAEAGVAPRDGGGFR